MQSKQVATMRDRGTWWFDSGGLVGWSYRPMARSDGQHVPLDLREWETRKRWLCELVGRLPALLGDFAHLGRVRATTRGGEDDCVIERSDQAGLTKLLGFLQRTEPIIVEASLDLVCLDRNLEPFEIPFGAELWINMRVDESGSLYLMTDAPVYLRFDLNADIYAPQSFGDMPSNALLAAINGPRLAAFLERVERDVPAQLLGMDGERYGGLVGPRGFTAPPNAFKDA
jgi:hypothetical protein